MGFRISRSLPGLTCVVVAAVTFLSAPAPPAWAQAPNRDFVQDVNSKLSAIPKEKRSELVIMPKLIKLEPPPAEVRSVERTQLILPSNPAWSAVKEWAMAPSQQDVLKALEAVTKEEDHRLAMVFALGYGVKEAQDQPDLIAANMYSELGDPPMLAAATFPYLAKMDEMMILANVEATRRFADGDAVGALDTLFDMLYFARQMADRPMITEMRWGMKAIQHSLERIRDIAYQDLKAEKHNLDYKVTRKYVERLEEETGYLGINRLALPSGTYAAVNQVLYRVLEYKKGVNEDVFAVVMAKISTGDRPLRLFSESAYWESIRPQHAGWYECQDMLVGRDGNSGIVYDWIKRWNLGVHDQYVKRPSDYKRFVERTPRFAVLRALLDGVEELFQLKLQLRTEVAGTRIGLAIYGYWRENNANFPPSLSSISPKYVIKVDHDPYASAKERPLEYFVPIRDKIPPQPPRQDPVPLRVQAYPPKPYRNFVIPLRDDTFALFSVGPDGSNGLLKDVTQGNPELEGDYILWPPMLSLIRKSMMDAGELK